MEHDRLISSEASHINNLERGQARSRPVSPDQTRMSAVPGEDARQAQTRPRSLSDDRVSPLPSETEHFTHSQQSTGAGDDEKTGSSATTDEHQEVKIPTEKLRASAYVLVLVLLYATLAVFAWVVLCILTKHPITATRHYGVDFDEPHAYGWTGAAVIHSFYTKNEEWLSAAQVIQSIVAVLTIPLTSAVCSKAAVVFVQQRTHGNLSLRQTMVLADRGWTDPIIYFRILAGGFKKYGTVFLLGATLLNILESIKTPTFPDMIPQLTDIADQFDPTWVGGLPDNNMVAVVARAAMTSADVTTPQGRLWTGESINCTEATQKSDSSSLPMSCVYGAGNTLRNMTELPDPFLAELPSGYSTGVIRQYLLRVNSTAHREIVGEADYPAGCESLPGAFYVRYGSINPNLIIMTGWGNWSLEACMPANLTHSPWKATRKRQDFTEELYLNISLVSADPTQVYTTPQEMGGLFKITLDTTAGYFELPNYANGQRPGKLLDESPSTICGGDCAWQASSFTDDPDASVNSSSAKVRRDNEDFSTTTNSTESLEMLKNRGPLSTVALALFGQGSFIEERMANPDGFVYPNQTYEEYRATPNSEACVGLAPFMGLLDTPNSDQIGNYLEPCLKNSVHNHDDVQRQVVNFVRALYYNAAWDGYEINDGSRITNAFTAAAFLANEAWLMSTTGHKSWSVTYDMGADTTVPVLSTTGMITVSALLGLFLLILLVLATYSALTARWTDQLDAFAMLRLGASLSEDIQLRLAHSARDVSALDELPGWIGDGTDGDGAVGELAPGARKRLTGRRKYAAYSVDRR